MVPQSAPLCEYVELSSDHLCSASSQVISSQLTYFCPNRPSFVTARVRLLNWDSYQIIRASVVVRGTRGAREWIGCGKNTDG